MGSLRVDPVIAPPNDRCSAPGVLTLGVPVTGTTAGALDDLSCGFGGGPDVFYCFTPPMTGADRATATPIASGDGCFARGPSGLAVDLIAGQTTFLFVDGMANGIVRVSSVVVPLNDTCQSPQTIGAGVVMGTTRGAADNFQCGFPGWARRGVPLHAGCLRRLQRRRVGRGSRWRLHQRLAVDGVV